MKEIMNALLEGQHKILTHNQADLLSMNRACLVVPVDIFEDQKHVLVVVFDLGALFRIREIFEHERVKLKASGYVLEGGDVMDPLYADPCFFGIRPQRGEVVVLCQVVFLNSPFRIGDRVNLDGLGAMFPDMDWRSWRKARFF